MKKIYTFTFSIFISATALPQCCYNYTQYFDGANTLPSNSIIVKLDTASSNVWQIGKPQKTIFHGAASVPKVIVTDTLNYYPVNNVSRFTFKLYIGSPAPNSIFALQWMQKLDMDQHKDGGIVELSLDSGGTWQNIFHNSTVVNFYGYQMANSDTLTSTGEYAFSGKDTTWRNIWLCVYGSNLINHHRIDFRFTFKSDSVNNNKEGWMIDNMLAHTTMVHPVNEIKGSDYFKVFPTVTTDFIHMESKKEKQVSTIRSVDLVDPDGKILEHFAEVPESFNINVSKYAAGHYFLRIIFDNKTEMHPVMLYKN